MTGLNTQFRLTTIFCLGAAMLSCAESDPAADDTDGVGTGAQTPAAQPATAQTPAAPVAAQPVAMPVAAGTGAPAQAATPAPTTPAAAAPMTSGANADTPAAASPPAAADMTQAAPAEEPATTAAESSSAIDPSTESTNASAGGAAATEMPSTTDELPADSCKGIGNGDACETLGTCSNLSCGLADTGSRVCTCNATWDCTSCAFPMGDDQPVIIAPPTADDPIADCDPETVVEKEVCPAMGDRCVMNDEICACWVTNSDDELVWDCDDAPSFWD